MRPSPKISSNRLHFIDWMRGLAACIMLQGHTFDAFADPQTRKGSAFILSQFIGGETAAIFLFLTGATYGLGMNRRAHLTAGGRVIAALKRARYLFLLGIIFRLQGWIFAWGKSPVSDLFKVDILNVMGAAAALIAILALWNGMDRVKAAMIAGLGIALASPLMSALDLHSLPGALRAYLVPSADGFPIFPWGAYMAFGVALGSMIPLVERNSWGRVMQWSAIAGMAWVMLGRYFADIPFTLYEKSEFWLNSPTLVACKMGIALIIGSFAYLWMEYLNKGWSFVRQLGTTSLVVYWVHVDLEYGPWMANYRGHWNAWQCLLFSAFLIPVMVGVSVAFTELMAHYKQRRFEVVTLPVQAEEESEPRRLRA